MAAIMTLSHRAKIIFLILGDAIALYISLFATLYLRYRGMWRFELEERHLVPFSVVFALWLIVFYIAGLYDLRRLRNNIEFLKILGLTLAANAALGIMFFYLIPIFGITPKTNLFIFLAVFGAVELYWRRRFNAWTALSQPLAHITLVGETPAMRELHDFLRDNPQFGFRVEEWIKENMLAKGEEGIAMLDTMVRNGRAEILVAPRDRTRDPLLAKALYEFFAEGRIVYDVPSFYEEVFRKVPIEEIREDWFFDHIVGHHRFYDNLKRAFEMAAAFLLLIVLSPLLFAIAILVKLTSPEPTICKQVRTGKKGAPYTHYKFRTMRSCHEKGAPQWKEGGNRDSRLTWAGRFLAPSHLDELPQLVNILKGELSFVGPRPERPEFVEMLKEKVPHYDIRHIVTPGITGWAQINYRYGSTVEDAAEKLRYELYYIKNRSLFLDTAIVIKTFKAFFANPE